MLVGNHALYYIVGFKSLCSPGFIICSSTYMGALEVMQETTKATKVVGAVKALPQKFIDIFCSNLQDWCRYL
jgi:hypothetical protein